MATIVARQSTALETAIGPILDSTGVAVTGGVVGDFKLKKTTGNFAALNGSATLTHVSAGVYDLVLTTSDTDTVGLCCIAIDDTTNCCASVYLQVIEEAAYDAVYAASAPGYVVDQPVNTTKWLGTACATPTVAGVPEVDVTHFNGTAGTFASGVPHTILADVAHGGDSARLKLGGGTDTIPSFWANNTASGGLGFYAAAPGAGGIGAVFEGDSIGFHASSFGGIGFGVTGQVSASHASNSINLGTGAITAGVIAANAITSSELADGAITAAKFAAGAITATVIADNAIDAATFAADVDAEILSYIVDDATRIDASALNTATVTTIPDILVDTAEIGAAGAGLTAIQLPSNGLANITGWTVAIVGNITGNLSGSVGSVTGAVGSVTAGVTLAASAVQAIWDALTSALTTTGSIGKYLLDRIVGTVASGTHNPQSGDAYARLGAPAGASIAADIAAVPGATATRQLGGTVAAANAVPTLEQAAMLVHQRMVGKRVTVSGTTLTIYAQDNTTVLATYTLDSSTAPTSATRAT